MLTKKLVHNICVGADSIRNTANKMFNRNNNERLSGGQQIQKRRKKLKSNRFNLWYCAGGQGYDQRPAAGQFTGNLPQFSQQFQQVNFYNI
jgi:hypothetical protein